MDSIRLQDQVPFELDLFEGKAVLSIVPFYMDQIQFRHLPKVPFFSSLNELNLRTYVRHEGKTGIYFFTLDTESFFGNWVARKFFKLPYSQAKIHSIYPSLNQNNYHFTSQTDRYRLNLNTRVGDSILQKSPLDLWITERYHLFLKVRSRVLRGDVFHQPWSLNEAQVNELNGDFTELVGVRVPGAPDHVVYGSSMDVFFPKFKILT